MDAGTDNGFTFTAPNWPSEPKEPVSRITSKRPSHPANSFYYPTLDKLPSIATLTFVKVCSLLLRWHAEKSRAEWIKRVKTKLMCNNDATQFTKWRAGTNT